MDTNDRSGLLISLVMAMGHAARGDRDTAETHVRELLDALTDAGIHPAPVDVVPDLHNNVGRGCSVNGTRMGRVWMVVAAVAGGRYLVRHLDTGETRSVAHSALTNLY